MKLLLTLCGSLVITWLIPFYAVGSKFGLPFKVHPWLYMQYASGGLFTLRVNSWSQMMIQVRLGAAEWRTVDAAEFSPMEVFGYRQRVDRVGIVTSKNRAMTERVRLRLAEWVAREYAKRHPEAGLITGVRMTQTSHPTNQQAMVLPPRHWHRDTLALEPKQALQILATFTIEDGKARAERTGTKPVSPPMPKVFERKKSEVEASKENGR